MELRIEIFNLHIRRGRLIEIEPVGKAFHSHHWGGYQASSGSRKPPSCFAICQESRIEALRFYESRNFDSNKSSNKIYYNADADMVLFRQDTCLHTVSAVCRSQSIQNVAFVCSEVTENCCYLNYFSGDEVNILRFLHGYYESDQGPGVPTSPAAWGGCRGLKKISITVKSSLWKPVTGRINEIVTLRPALSNALTFEQLRITEAIQDQIKKVQNDTGLCEVGYNMWTGSSKPKFEFVNFVPEQLDNDPRIYEAMLVPHDKLRAIPRSQRSAFLNGFEFGTGVKLFLPCVPKSEGNEGNIGVESEMGFFGHREAIERAKEQIWIYLIRAISFSF
ncbi:hypothetical protein BKA61DRAFT_709393 [Leptodontidium sp. MPI-SDFR-AT-0119]|nr:hypothetical protein BKA61DRAFT_709393 [Leptodontidium sp. MPI-SDFR-AT-0119]